jgi:hypothetical protein
MFRSSQAFSQSLVKFNKLFYSCHNCCSFKRPFVLLIHNFDQTNFNIWGYIWKHFAAHKNKFLTSKVKKNLECSKQSLKPSFTLTRQCILQSIHPSTPPPTHQILPYNYPTIFKLNFFQHQLKNRYNKMKINILFN